MYFQKLGLEIDKDLEETILFNAIENDIGIKKKKCKNKRKKPKSKYNYINTRLKSGIKIKTVLLLLMTLIANTYAWFIYISTVSMDISMHVKSWEFKISDGQETQDFEFTVDDIFPGMQEEKHELDAENSGEMDAELKCDITYMKVLGNEYKVGESYIEGGETKVYTPEKLFEILNSYPFKIQIYIDDNLYDGNSIEMTTGDSNKISFTVNWDYEVDGDEDDIAAADAIDTYWGNEAYKFKSENPDEYCIKIDVTISATQKKVN